MFSDLSRNTAVSGTSGPVDTDAKPPTTEKFTKAKSKV